MNFSINIAKEKDISGWNSFLNQAQHGTIFHTWEWQNILSEAFGWKIIRLICRSGEIILGVYPIAIITPSAYQVPWEPNRSPWASSLPPNNFGGPVVSDKLSKQKQKTIYKKLVVRMETILFNFKCSKIEIRLSPWDCFIENVLPEVWKELGYEIKKHMPTYVLKLNQSFKKIQNNFRKDVKKAIRQGKKRRIEIFSIEDKKDIMDCYRIYLESMAKSFVLPRFNLKSFYMAYELFVKKNQAKFLIAECEGIRIATLIRLFWKNKIFGWISGSTSDRDYLRCRPNHLLKNYMIEEACKHGFTFYEYGCAPTVGLKNFKSGWNADRLPLYTAVKIIRRPLLKNLFFRRIAKLVKHLTG